jgi:phosphatidylinositol-4,5-bisphosphate 3-kinase
MLSTDIPQLSRFEDLYYLRDAFSLDKNDAEAAELFKELISVSLNTMRTQINNAIHIFAHPNKWGMGMCFFWECL